MSFLQYLLNCDLVIKEHDYDRFSVKVTKVDSRTTIEVPACLPFFCVGPQWAKSYDPFYYRSLYYDDNGNAVLTGTEIRGELLLTSNAYLNGQFFLRLEDDSVVEINTEPLSYEEHHAVFEDTLSRDNIVPVEFSRLFKFTVLSNNNMFALCSYADYCFALLPFSWLNPVEVRKNHSLHQPIYK